MKDPRQNVNIFIFEVAGQLGVYNDQTRAHLLQLKIWKATKFQRRILVLF